MTINKEFDTWFKEVKELATTTYGYSKREVTLFYRELFYDLFEEGYSPKEAIEEITIV